MLLLEVSKVSDLSEKDINSLTFEDLAMIKDHKVTGYITSVITCLELSEELILELVKEKILESIHEKH